MHISWDILYVTRSRTSNYILQYIWNTETETSKFLWHFCHCLHRKLSSWQLLVHQGTKTSSKLQYFRFGECNYCTCPWYLLLALKSSYVRNQKLARIVYADFPRPFVSIDLSPQWLLPSYTWFIANYLWRSVRFYIFYMTISHDSKPVVSHKIWIAHQHIYIYIMSNSLGWDTILNS